MSITVSTASQHCLIVCAMQLRKAAGDSLTITAVMIADRRIAVPVPSGWKAHTASYGLLLYSVMEMRRCSPGQAILLWPIAKILKLVQIITVAETTIQGSHPCQAGTDDEAPSAAAGCCRIAYSRSGAGRQTRKNRSVTISDPSDERTSVSV